MAEARRQILPVEALPLHLGGKRGSAGAALQGAAPALACLAIALASVALQGFRFGVNNNLFHIPIVLRWYDLPQFANDAFIQSLRRFATPVFPFLSLFTDSGNIALVFATAHVLARALAFYAVLQVVRACGVGGVAAGIALAGVALCVALYGDSPVGKDELLPDYFTHTELAQALALLGAAWLIRGAPIKACLAVGATFDLNAVVGIWALAPVALTFLFGARQPWPARIRAMLAGAGALAVAALPEAIWLLHDQRLSAPRFDYRAYLVEYYPYHFFIGWAKWSERLALAQQLLCGLMAAALLPKNRLRAVLSLTGFVLVFAAGVVVDQHTHSRLILNLHLLRVDGMIVWIAAPLTAAAASSALRGGSPLHVTAAVAVLAGLVHATWPIVALGLAALLAARLPAAVARAPRWMLRSLPRPALAGSAAAALAIGGSAALAGGYAHAPRPPAGSAPPRDEQLIGAWPAAPQWRQTTAWARTSTPASAVFLVPPRLDFVEAAERRSWFGWKEGASAMWASETYAAWKQRKNEIDRLHDAQSALAYACAHRIDYVIFDRRPGAPAGVTSPLHDAVFSNRWFSAVKVGRCAQTTTAPARPLRPTRSFRMDQP